MITISSLDQSKISYQVIKKLHLECLPSDIIPNLSNLHYQFIYEMLQDNEQAYSVAAFYEHELVGIGAIVFDPGAFYKKMMLLKKNVISSIFNIIFTAPMVFVYILSIFLLRGKQYQSECPEIFCLFIKSQYRGRGIGKMMIDAMHYKIFDKFQAITTKTSDEKSKNFYLNAGYKLISHEYRGVRKMYVLIKNLNEKNSVRND